MQKQVKFKGMERHEEKLIVQYDSSIVYHGSSIMLLTWFGTQTFQAYYFEN